MDIITSLVNTLQKQKVTFHTQEAFFIALHLNSTQINNYVIYNTSLVLNLINDVCKKYVLAFDSLVVGLLNSNLNSGGGGQSQQGGNNSSASSSRQQIDGAVFESFFQALRLCLSIYTILIHNVNSSSGQGNKSPHVSNLSNDAKRQNTFSNSPLTSGKFRMRNEGKEGENGMIDGGGREGDSQPSSGPSASSTTQLLLDNYIGYFLYGTLHNSILQTSETSAHACQILLTRILTELSWNDQKNHENNTITTVAADGTIVTSTAPVNSNYNYSSNYSILGNGSSHGGSAKNVSMFSLNSVA
eukprot:gene41184-50979_t